jgi:hypothetical protein
MTLTPGYELRPRGRCSSPRRLVAPCNRRRDRILSGALIHIDGILPNRYCTLGAHDTIELMPTGKICGGGGIKAMAERVRAIPD